MKTIHKLNGGNGATLCNACRVIITEGLTSDVLCKECNDNYTLLSQSFDSRSRVMKAVKDMAIKRIAKEVEPVIPNEEIHFNDYHFEVTQEDSLDRSWNDAESMVRLGFRLPTIDELRLMYLCKGKLGMENEEYWSSSEYSNYGAWGVNFSSGDSNFSYKDNSLRVRAVRTIDGYLDSLIQTQITPNALIKLGFKEEYQHSIDGIAGFLYYTLTLTTVEFCSTSLGENEPLCVMLGHEGEFQIHNLRKLGDLILSLKEVS